MENKRELVKIWGNDAKRKAFIQDYKAWDDWFIQPELGLTFYKYDLPDGGRIIIMEYLRERYYGETANGDGLVTDKKYYLQMNGKPFKPSAVGGSTIYEHLMRLKEEMTKELRQKA